MTTCMLMSKALQRAMVTRLKSDTALMAMINGVFDDVPHATALPYITFAAAQMIDQSTRHITIAEVMLSLHVWSDYAGKDQVLTIMQRIENVLKKASLTLMDGQLISFALARCDVSTQGTDLQRRRGRMEYVAQISHV